MKVSELKELFEVEGVAELDPEAQYLIKVPDSQMKPEIMEVIFRSLQLVGLEHKIIAMPASWKIYKIEEV